MKPMPISFAPTPAAHSLPHTGPSRPRATLTSHPSWSKPGLPGTCEQLIYRQLRLQRMIELLIQGYSYRAIAREMGLARSTVLRMKYDAARFGILTRVPFDQSLLKDSTS